MMTSRGLQILLLLGASWTITACDQGRKNPPDAAVRVVNAVPSYESILFRRETTGAAVDLQYQTASERFTYDVDQYDFNLDVPTADAATRITFSPQLRADMHYAFVLMEVGGIVEPVVLEYAPLAAAATGAQAIAAHAAGGFPAVSVYIEAPGTDVTAVAPRATLAFGETLAPIALGAGDHEITLTEGGNPANVLLASGVLTLPAATSTILVISSGADIGLSDLALIVVGDTAGVFVDKNVQAELRVLNAANDGAPRDVALNGQFAPPLFAAVPLGTATAYAPAPAAENTVNVTPAGNPGVLELTQTLTLSANLRHTLLVTGESGALTHVVAADDRRRLANGGRLRVFNAASQFTAIAFYVVPPGTDTATSTPVFGLGAPGRSSYVTAPPGNYELVLRASDGSIVAGPQAITIEAAGLYEVLALNGPDTASAQVVLLEDFAAPAQP